MLNVVWWGENLQFLWSKSRQGGAPDGLCRKIGQCGDPDTTTIVTLFRYWLIVSKLFPDWTLCRERIVL